MLHIFCAYGMIPVLADTIETTHFQHLLKHRGELVAAFPINMVTDIKQHGVSILKDGKNV